MLKPKLSKEELDSVTKELADWLTTKKLFSQKEYYLSQIELLNAKYNDIERKIRSLQREILE